MEKVVATLQSRTKFLGRCVGAQDQPDPRFFVTVRDRVERHLAARGLSRKSNLIGLAEYVTHILAYWLLYFWGLYTNSLIAWFLVGVVTARLGFIMHMGLHSAWSKRPWVNQLVGLSMDLLGSNSLAWVYQHQVSHHMDPNEYMKDNDISVGDPYLRFNKWIKRTWWHKWNHWLTVMIMPLGMWRWYFDDIRVVWSGVVGNVKFHSTTRDVIETLFWKIWWAYRMIYLPVAHWGLSGMMASIIAAFVAAEYLENIFIVNHIQSNMEPPASKHWAVRQIHTTANWSSGSVFWNWFSGGLNHQIEHHLFPGVSHYLYPEISPIVREACREFGLPYFDFKNYADAWKGMFFHLRELGYEEDDVNRPKPFLPLNLCEQSELSHAKQS